MNKNFNIRLEVIFELEGKKVIDSNLARLLILIDKYGSILAASKAIKMSYSRAWESIVKAERILREKLIEARRGGEKGGGTRLTKFASLLLKEYLDTYKKLTKRDLKVEESNVLIPSIIYMGSHDLGVSFITGLLKKRGIAMEVSWIGSGNGIALVSLGEASIAGIHLFDPETNKYNMPYLKRFWYGKYLALIRGYERSVGLVLRENIKLRDLFKDILEGKKSIVNRQKASGTRVLLDYLLLDWAKRLGYKRDIINSIKGYNIELVTHNEVAEEVVKGNADAGICIESVASQYGLKFHRIKWESFDFVVKKENINKREIREFISVLKSKEFRSHLRNLKGYRISNEVGKVIYG